MRALHVGHSASVAPRKGRSEENCASACGQTDRIGVSGVGCRLSRGTSKDAGPRRSENRRASGQSGLGPRPGGHDCSVMPTRSTRRSTPHGTKTKPRRPPSKGGKGPPPMAGSRRSYKGPPPMDSAACRPEGCVILCMLSEALVKFKTYVATMSPRRNRHQMGQ